MNILANYPRFPADRHHAMQESTSFTGSFFFIYEGDSRLAAHSTGKNLGHVPPELPTLRLGTRLAPPFPWDGPVKTLGKCPRRVRSHSAKQPRNAPGSPPPAPPDHPCAKIVQISGGPRGKSQHISKHRLLPRGRDRLYKRSTVVRAR